MIFEKSIDVAVYLFPSLARFALGKIDYFRRLFFCVAHYSGGSFVCLHNNGIDLLGYFVVRKVDKLQIVIRSFLGGFKHVIQRESGLCDRAGVRKLKLL